MVCDTENLTFSADVKEGILRLALLPNADGCAVNRRISVRSCV